MDIASLAQSDNSASSRAQARIADDFDTFLTLLTTQLQNQDPMEPTDSAEFTNQLVAFAGVEQQIQTNQNLESLSSMTALGQTHQAVSYLGRDALVAADGGTHEGEGLSFEYDLGGSADSTRLQILDGRGDIVLETEGATNPGRHSFSWPGLREDGSPAAPGEYRLRVVARDGEERALPTDVFLRGQVSEVETEGLTPVLTVAGNSVPLADVLAIRQPQ